MEDNNNQKVILLEGEKEKLLDHNYDGIHELDYPLPRWWIIIFVVCVIHSAMYFAYYHLAGAPGLKEVYKTESVTWAMKNKASQTVNGPAGFTEDELNAVLAADGVTKGLATYQSTCLSCHGEGGKGGIGPNLADNFWINGKGTGADIHKAITDGIPAKGMPAWGATLGPQVVYELTAYVQSLKGTNPPEAKAPQGEEVK